MANLQLTLPVWVQHKDRQYHIRPLFMDEPHSQHKRYDIALRNFQRNIRKAFRQYYTNRESLEPLLWFMFSPEVQFETMKLEFTYGKRFFQGKVPVYWFRYVGYTVIGLPSFENEWFIPTEAEANRQEIENAVVEHIQKYARQYKKEQDEEMDMDDFVAAKKEFVDVIEMPLNVREPKIKIREKAADIFKQFFRNDMKFEGRIEIAKTGREFNNEDLEIAYYRDEIAAQIYHHVYGTDNVPIVLLGARKAGKTALLHEAARRYKAENVQHDYFKLDNVWHIDPTRIISGMSVIGMWQKRFEAIIKFAITPNKNYLSRRDKLYFDNVIPLFRIGKSAQNNMNLSDVLKPYLQKKQLQVILECTPEVWSIAGEMDRGFTDLFKVIRIDEPSPETSTRIIGKLRSRLENQHDVQLTNGALLKLMELHRRFHTDKVMIGTVATYLHQLMTKYRSNYINERMVLNEFSQKTHLNHRLTDNKIKIEKAEFEDYFESRLIGQPKAVECMADVLHTIKAQLNNPRRPFGSFLFIGPTGVGKTEAAKVLSSYLFTHEDRLLRFDMNEYIDGNAVNRLVGDFYNPEGQLTAKIRHNPSCVLLFDEIEKAHPDVHNLLLQVLGEGRLTDSLGRTVRFFNTVIIMTSNLGARRAGQQISLQTRDKNRVKDQVYAKAIKDFFRPEFVNRIDKTVIFSQLTAKDIAKITWLQINQLLQRHGFIRRHSILNVSPEVLTSIAQKGFAPEMGARALKRQIEKDLTVLLAEQLVAITPDCPILINLSLEKNQLRPHIVPFQHVAANEHPVLPHFSSKMLEKEHFQQLLEDFAELKADILDFQDEEEERLEALEAPTEADKAVLNNLLVLKESLHALESRLYSIDWAFKHGRGLKFKGSNFNMKMVSKSSQFYEDKDKAFFTGLYFTVQVNDYLNEVAESAQWLVDHSQGFLTELVQEMTWLEFYFAALETNGVEQIALHINPLVTMPEQGEELDSRVNYLLRYLYMPLFDQYSFKKMGNGCIVFPKGAGVHQLFQQEVGIHLFFEPHQTPFPIEVSIYKLDSQDNPLHFSPTQFEDILAQTKTDKKVHEVIRLYHLHQNQNTGKRQIKGNLTDLRTGLLSDLYIEHQDRRLLFYANLPEEFRDV